MTEKVVRIHDTPDGARWLTLDRPGAHNAIGTDMLAQLTAAIEAARGDGIRCLVLTGEGAMFSAGGNLSALKGSIAKRDVAAERSALDAASDTVRLLAEFPAPTLAGINGPAAGGGLALALACDMRVMQSDARLAYAYDRIGLAGDLGINWLLVRLIGSARARAVALGGAVPAERALAMGLVDICAPADDFAAQLSALAARMARLPQAAAAAIKRNLDAAAHQDFATAAAQENASFQSLRADPEHRTAIEAMLSGSKGRRD